MNPLRIKIEEEYIELVKLLKLSGLAETGGHAKAMVENGQVSVNGEVELRKKCKIRPGALVTARGESVELI